jgi:hypothetical protein
MLHQHEPVSNRDVLRALCTDESPRRCILECLAAVPFAAFFWEFPPLSVDRWSEPFEFVVSEAPTLGRVTAEASAFQQHLARAGPDGIAEFANLCGDAWLLAPEPRAAEGHYAHLGAFVRGAPLAQRHALLARLGQAVLGRVSDRPLWLSTSGLGVYWLHVRLDSWPKYYQYGPYKRWPSV